MLHQTKAVDRPLLATFTLDCSRCPVYTRVFGLRLHSVSNSLSSIEKRLAQKKKGRNMAHLQTPGSGGRNSQNNFFRTPPSAPASARRGRKGDLPKTDAPLIAELSRAALDQLQSSEELKITDLNHLASYNWLEGKAPTIAVPGKCCL